MTELEWVMERAVEHYGPERATRNLRRFYPWYMERWAPKALPEAMSATTLDARRLLARSARYRAAAAWPSGATGPPTALYCPPFRTRETSHAQGRHPHP